MLGDDLGCPDLLVGFRDVEHISLNLPHKIPFVSLRKEVTDSVFCVLVNPMLGHTCWIKGLSSKPKAHQNHKAEAIQNVSGIVGLLGVSLLYLEPM